MGRKKIEESELRTRIARRLDEHRDAKGLSKADLARRSNIDPTVIGRMLKGEYLFSDHHLEALATALGLDPAQLLPSGPSGVEAKVLAAIRDRSAGEALHALAVALGMTVRQVVASAGLEPPASGPTDTTRIAGVGWAAAALMRSIAQAVTDDPTRAAWLVSTWLHTDAERISDAPPLTQLAERFANERSTRGRLANPSAQNPRLGADPLEE